MSPKPHAAAVLELARAVRARRKEHGLTQVELGRFAGCGPDFVYDLEAGKSTIRLAKLLDVLAVLGLALRLTDGKRALAVDDAVRGRPEGSRS
jgi:y4mF family transcriptional regulator